MQDGYNSEAIAKLGAAFFLWPRPALAYWWAVATEKSGQLVEAATRYRLAQTTPFNSLGEKAQVHRQAGVDATEALKRLWPQIPRIDIQLQGATPENVIVFVDGLNVPRESFVGGLLLNPGRHLVTVAPDRAAWNSQGLVVPPPVTKTIDLDPIDVSQPPNSDTSPYGRRVVLEATFERTPRVAETLQGRRKRPQLATRGRLTNAQSIGFTQGAPADGWPSLPARGETSGE